MPRGPRLDAPGALHHVIARGIERRGIFPDDADRSEFLQRLATVLTTTGSACYAWCLMPNHLHLLWRSAHVFLGHCLRRILGGYASAFNRRHRRSGHLFRNRFKSTIVQDDLYLLELVRYIHLNPPRRMARPQRARTAERRRITAPGTLSPRSALLPLLRYFPNGLRPFLWRSGGKQ